MTPAAGGDLVADEHLKYVQTLEHSGEETRYRSTAEVIDRLASTPVEQIPEPPVYVESHGRDREVCRQLVDDLKRVWQDRYGSGSMPDIQPVPYKLLTEETGCIGVILVWGMKEAASINNQIKTVVQAWRLHGCSPVGRCWLAALHPQRLEGASFRDMETFDFDPEHSSREDVTTELERVVDSLHRQVEHQRSTC